MVAFGNPVKSHIYAKGEAHPAGSFIVTATFADHIAGGRLPGVDIGDGKCGDPIIAQCDGTISLAKLIGYPTPNALTVRYRSTLHPDFEPAATHLASITPGIVVGAKVTKGQQVGTLGMTGATACHLHMGLKQLINGVWTEIDGWPFLEQNGATEDDVLQGANPKRIVNRKTWIKTDATRFRSSPFVTADNILTEYSTGVGFGPDWSVEGTTVGTSKLWYGGWGGVKGQTLFGYMHESVLNPLIPSEQSGYTDVDLNNAKKTAANVVSAAASSAASKF